MESQRCGGLGSQSSRYTVPGYRYKGPKVQDMVSWGYGALGIGDAEGAESRGHRILSLEDPGHTRAWTHGSRAHGVWAHQGLWDTRAWEAADVPGPHTRCRGRR